MSLKHFSSARFSSFCSRLRGRSSHRIGSAFKRVVAGALVLLCVSCSSAPVMAAELYTPDGFAKQIDTYKDLALSASNAIRNKSWDDNVSVASSVGSVTNTVDFSGCYVTFRFDDGSESARVPLSLGGTFSYVVPSGRSVNSMILWLHTSASLPNSGKYLVQCDFASDTSITYNSVLNWMRWASKNQSFRENAYTVPSNMIKQSSGDIYFKYTLSLVSNLDCFTFDYAFKESVNSGGAIGGRFAINFTSSSGTPNISSPGTAPSDTDIQSGIASTTTQIASSVNEVYESIQQLMQHISNQLAALWDQIYNYCHVPTYNKLQEILLSIRNISMGSDLQKIADQISNSTTEQTNDLISNANSNQEKTDQAIQKHGNFIIDGLKSLFIPSDEYFNAKFSDLNEFFKDRFGFLYTPIDLLVRFVNLIYGASNTFDGIPFPELSWDGHVLLAAQTVKFDILDIAAFKQVQKYLYFLTDVMMIGALVSLIHRKFEEVMQN